MNTRNEMIQKLDEKYKEVYALRAEIVEMTKSDGLEEVENYLFKDRMERNLVWLIFLERMMS